MQKLLAALLAILSVAALYGVAEAKADKWESDLTPHQKGMWHKERALWNDQRANFHRGRSDWHVKRHAYHTALAKENEHTRATHLDRYTLHKNKANFHSKEAASADQRAKLHQQAFKYHTEQAIADEKTVQTETAAAKKSESSSVDHGLKRKEAAQAQTQFETLAGNDAAKAQFHRGRLNTLNNIIKSSDTQAISSYSKYKEQAEKANMDKTESARQSDLAKNFYRLSREFKSNAAQSYDKFLKQKASAQSTASSAASHKAEADKYTALAQKERSDEVTISKKSSDESIKAQQFLAEMNVNKQKQQDHVQAKVLNKKQWRTLKQQYDTAVQKAQDASSQEKNHRLVQFQASNRAARYNRATERYRRAQKQHYDEFTRLKNLSDNEKKSRDDAQSKSSSLTAQANNLEQIASKQKAKSAEEHTANVENARMAEERKAKSASETKLADDLEAQAKSLDAQSADATSQAKEMSAMASNERAKQKSAETGAESHTKAFKALRDKIHELNENVRSLTTSITTKESSMSQHKSIADDYGRRATESSKMADKFTALAAKHQTLADNNHASARAHRAEARKLVEAIQTNADLAKTNHLKKDSYNKQATEVFGKYKAETDASNKAKNAEALHKQAATTDHAIVQQNQDDIAKISAKLKQEIDVTTKLKTDAALTSDKAKTFYSKYSTNLEKSKSLKAAADTDEALAAKAKGEADTHTSKQKVANKQSESHTARWTSFQNQEQVATGLAKQHTQKSLYHGKRHVLNRQQAVEAKESKESHRRKSAEWKTYAAKMLKKVDNHTDHVKKERALRKYHHGQYQYHTKIADDRVSKNKQLEADIQALQASARSHIQQANKQKEAKNADQVEGNKARLIAAQALAHQHAHANSAAYHKRMADFQKSKLLH